MIDGVVHNWNKKHLKQSEIKEAVTIVFLPQFFAAAADVKTWRVLAAALTVVLTATALGMLRTKLEAISDERFYSQSEQSMAASAVLSFAQLTSAASHSGCCQLDKRAQKYKKGIPDEPVENRLIVPSLHYSVRCCTSCVASHDGLRLPP